MEKKKNTKTSRGSDDIAYLISLFYLNITQMILIDDSSSWKTPFAKPVFTIYKLLKIFFWIFAVDIMFLLEIATWNLIM